MSIECDNTTPLAGKAGTLTLDNSVFDSIFDLSTLIDTNDPLDRIDRASVVSITDTLNNVLESEELTDYPTLGNRYSQFPLTYTEVADYMLTNNVNVDILQELQAYSAPIGPSATITGLFDDLDFHYEQNLGKTISEGLCGQFANALTDLAAAFSLLNSVVDKLNGLNLNDLDVQAKIQALAAKLKIDAITASIKEIITKLVEKVKRKVLQAVNSIIPQLKNMGCASRSLYRKIRREIDQVNEFFSKDNIDRIKDNVESFISGMVASFQRMTFNNIGAMLHSLCLFAERLQDILSGPGDKLNKIVEATAVELKALQNMGLINTKDAVDSGAARVSDEERAKKIKESRENLDITDPCPTPEEIEIISKISEDGLGPYITFSQSVIDNKEWQDIDNSVWSKLIRVAGQVNKGYEDVKEQEADELAQFDTDGDGVISSEENPNIVTSSARSGRSTGLVKTRLQPGDAGYVDLLTVTDPTLPDPNVVKVKASGRADFALKALGSAGNWLGDKLEKITGIEVTDFDGLTKTLKPGDAGYTELKSEIQPDNFQVIHGVKKKTDVTSKLGGVSNHIHLTGFAVDVKVTDENRVATIIAASKAGFSGIGVYKTFLHLDVGSRRSWVAGDVGVDIKQSEKFAGQDLALYNAIADKHNIDGYRKSRGDEIDSLPYNPFPIPSAY